MSEDKFVDRLRGDARPLRYEIDSVAATRLRARVRARLTQPTVSQLIAGWFRPLAASLAALALVTTIGVAVVNNDQPASFGSDPVEVSMAGVTYSVVD